METRKKANYTRSGLKIRSGSKRSSFEYVINMHGGSKKKDNTACPQPSVRHGGGSVMVHAAFQPVVFGILSKSMEI